jgi:type VI protein secretion system component Hcp
MYGDGGTSGTSNFSEISLMCVGAGSSLNLLNFLNTGKHFPKVVIDATKSTGGNTEEVFAQITLEEGIITGFSQSMTDNSISDQVQVAFKKYKHEVWEQDDTGAVKSAGDHGYDLSLNEAV